MVEAFGHFRHIADIIRHPVSPQLAMSCMPFASGVKLISESMASLPMHVYKKAAAGGKQRVTDHPLHALLDDARSDL